MDGATYLGTYLTGKDNVVPHQALVQDRTEITRLVPVGLIFIIFQTSHDN